MSAKRQVIYTVPPFCTGSSQTKDSHNTPASLRINLQYTEAP